MKHALTACALALAISAHADPLLIGVHTVTWHDHNGYCGVNPGIYARWPNGLTLGTYHNSDCLQSFYAGKTWEWKHRPFGVAVTAGLVTGYKGNPVGGLLVPSASLDLGAGFAARVAFIPKVEKHSANAIHLMIERTFQ